MIRYAVKMPQTRDGEFEFLCATQSHFTKSLEVARKEVASMLNPRNADFQCATKTGWRFPTRAELIDDLGGEPIIYELNIRKVK